MKLIILIMIILLAGCAERATVLCLDSTVYVNDTRYVNNTIYQDVEIIKVVNITKYTANCSEPTTTENKLNLRLVRELKACEYELEWLNKTDVGNKFTQANSSLRECRDKLERIEDVLK